MSRSHLQGDVAGPPGPADRRRRRVDLRGIVHPNGFPGGCAFRGRSINIAGISDSLDVVVVVVVFVIFVVVVIVVVVVVVVIVVVKAVEFDDGQSDRGIEGWLRGRDREQYRTVVLPALCSG